MLAPLTAGAALACVRCATEQARGHKRLATWIKDLAQENGENGFEPTGDDEFTDVELDLATLDRKARRQHALDMVSRLAKAVESKNDELEAVVQELHATQDAMIGSQKLAELGQLTAGVAHEIRNPLHFVQNFAEVSAENAEDLETVIERSASALNEADRALAERLTQEMKGNMTRISEHVGRANRIITDMLGMGRNQDEETREIDLSDLTRRNAMLAYHACRAQAPDRDIMIEELTDQDPIRTTCRPQEIARVVVNIVSNACQAAAEHTPPDAEASRRPTIKVETRQDGGWAVITVTDNGPGVAPDIRDRIFSPFFTTRRERGTGLGLSMSHEIVRAHGGEITVADADPQGSRFTVSIPAAGPPTSAGQATTPLRSDRELTNANQ